MKSYTTAIEILDDTDELVAKLETFDECCVSVKIDNALFTLESWQELSANVEEALRVMLPND